ncbi:MAG: hypothetical protein ACK559_34600 [bacterium]
MPVATRGAAGRLPELFEDIATTDPATANVDLLEITTGAGQPPFQIRQCSA